MMETNTKASNKCSKPHCRNDAASRRAKLCTDCFRTSASCASSKRKVFGGNTTTARGKGVLGNKGNTRGKGVLGNKGNMTTGPKKKQAGKKGGKTTGPKKRQAGKKGGKRSALRRSAKMLLIVKNPWLDLILSRDKTWEIRDSQTKQRGKIHLALSGAGGRIVGQCHITDSVAIDKITLRTTFPKHRIKDLARITYRRPHAWVLSKARRYMKPFIYSHPHGAIKWVRL